MVSAIGTAWDTAKRYGNYGANFILGTGADTIGAEIKAAAQAGKATGASLPRSIFEGFKTGVVKSNQQVAQTGFLTNLKNVFTSLPSEMSKGWKNANVANKNIFSKYLTKTGQFLKPLSKTLPFAMNALWLISFIPSIMERTQDQGILGGIVEAGKSIGKMALCALGGAVGAAFGGFGAIGGGIAGAMLSELVFGKDYSLEKAEKQEKLAAAQEQIKNSQTGSKLDYIS